MNSNQEMELRLREQATAGVLVQRYEDNRHLKVSYRGAGVLVSEKWNVKIYNSGSVVCNDMALLQDIVNNQLKEPDTSKILLQIDDAGIGFPLGGVMVGVSDGARIETDVVDVSFFRTPVYETSAYLDAFAKKGLAIVKDRFKATVDTHRIEICTGYVNKNLKELLRVYKYDVRVVEIKGLLQENLEKLYREYIEKLAGKDVGYDPKDLISMSGPKSLGQKYYEVLRWAKPNVPHLLKNGWESLRT